MRMSRAIGLLSVTLVVGASPAWSQGRGMMGRGMMAGDSTTAAIMPVVHQLLMNHEKLRRTVELLPNGIRTVTESDDPAMAQLIKTHVVGTGALVAKGEDPDLPMSSPALRSLLRNGQRVTRHTEETARGVIVTETSSDSATVAWLQQHAAEVSELVKRGREAAHEAMMRNRGMRHRPPGS
jgi:hypothetical protein